MAHWMEYGRNFFTRFVSNPAFPSLSHLLPLPWCFKTPSQCPPSPSLAPFSQLTVRYDYENVDSGKADAMVAHLKTMLGRPESIEK